MPRIKQSLTTPQVPWNIQQDRIHLGLSTFSQSMWQVGRSSTGSRKLSTVKDYYFLAQSPRAFFNLVFNQDSVATVYIFTKALSPIKLVHESTSPLSLQLVTRLHLFVQSCCDEETQSKMCSSNREGQKGQPILKKDRTFIMVKFPLIIQEYKNDFDIPLSFFKKSL